MKKNNFNKIYVNYILIYNFFLFCQVKKKCSKYYLQISGDVREFLNYFEK